MPRSRKPRAAGAQAPHSPARQNEQRMTFNWKKAALAALTTAMGAYLLLAVTAFNEPGGRAKKCSEVKIDIADNVVDGFLNADEIKAMLQRKGLYPLSKPMESVNVRAIEETLRKSPFVAAAQCYKTEGGKVCIELSQRMPVIRVKADNGDDYYIDNHGGIMQNTKYVSDIIIATGPISRNYARRVLTRVGNIIVADRFCHRQIVQVNVLADGSMEIVPRVGDNIVYLGRPVDVRQKLDRLAKFYKYGLSRVGWNRYSYISLEFDNQIICKKRKRAGGA